MSESSVSKVNIDIKNFMLHFGINTCSDSATLLMEMAKYCLLIAPSSFKMCDLYEKFGVIRGVPANKISGGIF